MLIYHFEIINLHCKQHQNCFTARCIWWLQLWICIQYGLVTYIDNLHMRVFLLAWWILTVLIDHEIRSFSAIRAKDQVLHQHNVTRPRPNAQSSQTLQVTSSVVLIRSRCSQTFLELSKVLSDSASAYAATPESTCSDGGAFRMLRYLTDRIVKFWSCWDLCTDLGRTSREAETTVLLCGWPLEQPIPLRRTAGHLVLYPPSRGCYITTRHFFFVTVTMIRYIIIWHALCKSLYIYIYGQSGRKW